MTLVLLHPVGLDHDCWQLTGLDGEKFDYPGHGDRPLPTEGFTLESIADEVVARFSGPLDLVGVSMGTAVALNTAVRHPDRVRSMLLAAGGAGRSANAPPPDPNDGSERALRPVEQLRLGLEIIDGPHMLPLENPGEFADAVRRHLA